MKKKIIGIAASVLLVAATCGGAVAQNIRNVRQQGVNAETTYVAEGTWTVTGMDEGSFVYGTTVAMPRAYIRLGGEDVAASAYVTLPNGSVVTGDTFTLGQAGKYVVCFSVKHMGKVYTESREFFVDAPFVSVGENSSAVVGTYTGCGSTKNNTGYLLRIADGEEVVFNKLIDISALTAQDALFSAFVTPDALGTADFNRVIFTLTDAIDETCSLTIVADRVVDSDWGDSITYFKAAGENQTLTGVEGIGTTGEKVHVNNEYGGCITHSFIGKASNGTAIVPSDNPMRFSYDKNEQTLKVGGVTFTDLDNAKYYKSPWNGFPSGKAKLTVSASGYNAKTANLCVTGIFGLDFDEAIVKDTTPPDITVNSTYERMPIGELGCTYPIPTATATDDYIGACAVDCKVYFAYDTSAKVSVPVENGAIHADKIGTYTIVYTACDYYGNTAEKTLQFNIAAEIEPLAVQLPEYEETYECGAYVALQEATATGGTGNAIVSADVRYNGNSMPVSGGSFKLSGAGTWEIVYTAVDYTGKTAQKKVSLTAQPSENPVFAEKPSLPKIFLNGYAYTLAEYYAETYTENSTEPTKQLCTVKVEDKNGTKTLAAGTAYTPFVENSGDTVRIVYVCDGGESDVYEIPVVTPRTTTADGEVKLDVTEYLYGTGFTKAASEANVEITATESGDVSWLFANALLHENFSVELMTVPEKDLFEGIRLTLTDSVNDRNAVSVIIEKKRGKTYMRCGETSAALLSGFESAETTEISLEYVDGTFRVGNVSVAVQSTDEGEAFTGFASEKVYLTVTMLNAEVGAQYNLRAISLNRFNENTADFAPPSVVISGDYGGTYDLGSTYEIPPVYAADVLAPNCTATMTVFTPSGVIATDVNGVQLKDMAVDQSYSVRLTEYGQYKVQYTAVETDWFGNKRVMQYTVSVYDDGAPDIVLRGVVTTGKVGEVYRLPSITVTDNVTAAEDLKIVVYAYTPDGKLKRVEDGIRFSTAGNYTFRVMAMDEFGNASYREFTVRVTK